MDLALNNLQRLICRKTKPNQMFVPYFFDTLTMSVCQFVYIYIHIRIYRGACGVMVIVVGIGHDDTSSNPGRD